MTGPRKSISRNNCRTQGAKPKAGFERASIDRILDANLNRAREGLRVAEEIARMILEDEALQKKIKTLRHHLSLLEKRLDSRHVLHHRRTLDDPGARHTSKQEKQRENVTALARANLRRCQEACRVLEEFSKLAFPAISPRFKALRFAAYDLEQDLVEKINTRSLA